MANVAVGRNGMHPEYCLRLVGGLESGHSLSKHPVR